MKTINCTLSDGTDVSAEVDGDAILMVYDTSGWPIAIEEDDASAILWSAAEADAEDRAEARADWQQIYREEWS